MPNEHETITVVIPSIPPRAEYLKRAMASVHAQTLQADAIVFRLDMEKEGAPANRHKALMQVETDWVAFLDDDDEFLPEHLETLMTCAKTTGADYVYSWYNVIGGGDPLPHFGKPFDPCDPVQTTITTLVRTDLAKQVGFLFTDNEVEPTPDGNRAGEDWMFTLGIIEAGGLIVHAPHRTWNWYHHGYNTSGLPDRW